MPLLIFPLLVKRIDLVLSSPKWILSLLSTNQLHKLEKSLFNSDGMTYGFLSWNIKQESYAYSRSLQSTDCAISFT